MFTYSFLDTTGAITSPSDKYIFQGEGIGEISIVMSTEKTAHMVAADGVVVGSLIAGDNGQMTIQCSQVSDLHKWLLDQYNTALTAAKNGDVSQWMGLSISLRNVVDGTAHRGRGGSFQKVPDKVYQKEAQMVTWVLMFADIQSE